MLHQIPLVVELQILAQADSFRQALERIGTSRNAHDKHGAGAEFRNPLRDHAVQSLDNRCNGNHGSDPDDDAEDRQAAADLARAQRVHGDQQIFPELRPRHSALSAATGSRRAAFVAGYMPKNKPIPELRKTPNSATQICTEAGNSVRRRSASAQPKPITTPTAPPATHCITL